MRAWPAREALVVGVLVEVAQEGVVDFGDGVGVAEGVEGRLEGVGFVELVEDRLDVFDLLTGARSMAFTISGGTDGRAC